MIEKCKLIINDQLIDVGPCSKTVHDTIFECTTGCIAGTQDGEWVYEPCLKHLHFFPEIKAVQEKLNE